MVTHYRLGIVVLILLYGLQFGIVMTVAFTPGTAIAEILVGVFLVVRFLVTIWQRIVTNEGGFQISGFFIGSRKAAVAPRDLVSIRFRWIQWEPFAFPGFAVFELHAQTSPDYYRVSRYGWSGNRELFRTIATMAAISPITLDARTQKALDAAAGQ